MPRLQKISKEQADARSMMTGRIVDSYTNIGTVKLFSHAGREETYARAGMDGFLDTVHRQMRKVTLFHVLVYANNSIALFAISALGIHLWLTSAHLGRRDRDRRRSRHAHQRHVAMDHVGSLGAVREHRHCL